MFIDHSLIQNAKAEHYNEHYNIFRDFFGQRTTIGSISIMVYQNVIKIDGYYKISGERII